MSFTTGRQQVEEKVPIGKTLRGIATDILVIVLLGTICLLPLWIYLILAKYVHPSGYWQWFAFNTATVVFLLPTQIWGLIGFGYFIHSYYEDKAEQARNLRRYG